ncbi:P-type ATPase, partial [Geodermatophilus maliterrae]
MTMNLLPRFGVARAALTVTARVAVTGASLAAVPALVTADLLGASTRTSVRAVRAAAGLTDHSVDRARTAAVSGVRAVGTLVTGADPLPTGRVRDLAVAARGLFEPPDQRRTPRTWADSGFVQVEVPEPAPDAPPDAGRDLRERLERLEGVRWAAVNEVVGRVLVAVDQRRVGVEDVVETVGTLHRTAAGDDGLPEREDHPADLEPVLAALASAAIDVLAVGVAAAGRALPVPALSRHVTLALPLLDSQDWLTRALTRRIGGVGTGLAFDGLSALLHSLTQSPTVPALNAIASVQQALEARARRQVWRRREEELCHPRPDDRGTGPVADDGGRPVPLPRGVVERYTARLGPATTAVALLVLALTRRPGRSADLVKALSPKAALQGRESFAATLDLLMCRAGVVPMDGSVYRRLDRVDCVVVDGAALCTGPPVVLEATAEAGDWDDARVWTAASRLLDDDGRADGGQGPDGTRLGPSRETPEAPGAQVRALLDGRRRVGTVVVTRELDPYAEALLGAAGAAGHLVVLTAHAGARDVAGMAGQVAPADEPLARVVRRLQTEGHGVLLVTATDAAALLAADVGVAPVGPERSPAWGADLLTGEGLAPVCRVVSATVDARAVSRRSVQGAVTGNVLGALLAAVGSALYGQRKATTPGKTATLVAIADGAWTAVRAARRPDPATSVHTPWHALDPDDVLRRLAALPDAPGPRSRRRVPGAALLRGPVRFGRTVAAELADPLTPVLGAGAGATAVLGESADAVLVGSVTVGNALLGALQRMRAETALESLLLEQDVLAHRETDGGLEEVPAGELRLGDVVAVSSGDVLAADARLLEVADLEVDESSLTGESLAVAKSMAATPGAEVADRRCMLFDGTTVVAGTGRAVVVAVGT